MNKSGIKYPLEINTSRGDLVVVTNGELYRSHLLNWLGTVPLERVMRRTYGMKDLLFNQLSNINDINNYIIQEINKYIPEITINVNTTINDNGELLITINWSYLEEEQTPLQVTL
jgi:phage baseplate assembly protein W